MNLRWLWCLLTGHEVSNFQPVGIITAKWQCSRCLRWFAWSAEHNYSLPWDHQFEAFFKDRKP
jgi:hypothetical protein